MGSTGTEAETAETEAEDVTLDDDDDDEEEEEKEDDDDGLEEEGPGTWSERSRFSRARRRFFWAWDSYLGTSS